MLKDRVSHFLHWLRTLITEPQNELTRWEKAVRYAYDLGVHGWRALQNDQAPQMAAALAYRTLFALLPVVIVSTVVVRAVQGVEQFQSMGDSVIDALGLDQVRLPAVKSDAKTATEVMEERVAKEAGMTLPTPTTGPNGDPATQAATTRAAAAPIGPAAEPGPADAPDVEVELETVSVAQFIKDMLRQATKINLAALGWAGLAVVIYSAISLLVTIEDSFNSIYGAPGGRSWVRRVPMYWLLLTLGPMLIVGTLYLDRRFSGIIDQTHGWSWLLTLVKIVWGFCVVWVLLFAVYRLLPNTAVRNKAALVGAFVAALLLVAGKVGLGAYFANAVSFSSLYGALGAIPLFMFWVYLMWLALLFGLEVAATVQMLAGRTFEEVQEKRPQNGLVDPVRVVNLMEIVTERFAQGLPTPSREISDQTCIPEALVAIIVDRLVKANVVHRVDGEENSIALALPPEQVSADRLLEIGYALVDEGGVGRVSLLVEKLREAQKRLAGDTTLATLLPATAAISLPTTRDELSAARRAS